MQQAGGRRAAHVRADGGQRQVTSLVASLQGEGAQARQARQQRRQRLVAAGGGGRGA